MTTLSVRIDGMDALRASINGMGRQVDYAASRAINATGKKIAEAMPAEMERSLDRPSPFTKRGVRVLKYANKAKLEATVGFMAAQEKYMQWATDGGTRTPGPGGLKLPSAIKLNEFGNIPKGIIKQLVAVANKEHKLGKVKGRRIAVSNKLELYYGDPTDHNGKQYPRGIYKRVTTGGKSQLIPLIVFPVKPARYRKRLDFVGKARPIVQTEWTRQFDLALTEALRTARP